MSNRDKRSILFFALGLSLSGVGVATGSHFVTFAGLFAIAVTVRYRKSPRFWDYLAFLLLALVIVALVPPSSPLIGAIPLMLFTETCCYLHAFDVSVNGPVVVSYNSSNDLTSRPLKSSGEEWQFIGPATRLARLARSFCPEGAALSSRQAAARPPSLVATVRTRVPAMSLAPRARVR